MDKKYIPLLSVFFILLCADACFAGDFDTITDRFRDAAATWQTIILQYATNLFWILAPISFVLTTGEAWIKGQISDATSFFAHFIGTCLFLGFFLWLLENGPAFAKTIIDSLDAIGAKAAGFDASSSASDIVTQAFQLFDKILALPHGLTDLGPYLIAVVVGILLLLIMALIAANLTIEYCAAWIILYAGCFFLGFGSTKWTSDMAITYFKTVLSTAVRLMAMILIVGIISNLMATKIASMQAEYTVQDSIALLVYAIIFLSLMNKVPNMLAGMVGGGQGASSLGVGTMMAAGGMGMAAASMAMSAASISKSLAGKGIGGLSSALLGSASSGAANAATSSISSGAESLGSNMGSGLFGGSSNAFSTPDPESASAPASADSGESQAPSSSAGQGGVGNNANPKGRTGKGAGSYMAQAARDFGSELEK